MNLEQFKAKLAELISEATGNSDIAKSDIEASLQDAIDEGDWEDSEAA